MEREQSPVLAYHVTLSNYGFWLPNDPRGSQSTVVRAENLKPFGEATKTSGRTSVAGAQHDIQRRLAAKRALVHSEVIFTGLQARSVGAGFAAMTAKSGYVIHACSILPRHSHLVVRRHRYAIEQVVRLLRQAATQQLLADDLHPFAKLRGDKGRLPSVWAQDFWTRFLFDEEQIANAIQYVEENPIKEGKPHQRWSFVTPFASEGSTEDNKGAD
jgi:REP element-mobilizing transposase RayT